MYQTRMILIILLVVAGGALGRRNVFKMDETFFLPQTMREAYRNITLKHSDRKGDEISKWEEGTHSAVSRPALPAINRSCPLTYVVVYNPNRIPDTIIEAVCLSNQCNNPGNPQPDEPSLDIFDKDPGSNIKLLNPASKCEPVHYFKWVKVRSQQKSSGKWQYLKRLLPVAIACTCNYKTQN